MKERPMPRPGQLRNAMIRGCALLLGAAILAPAAASAQSFQRGYAAPAEPTYRVCLQNRGAFVAYARFEALISSNNQSSWVMFGRYDAGIPVMQGHCAQTPRNATAIRINARVHTGFDIREACTVTLQPAREATVTVHGTTLNNHCSQ